MNEYMNPELIKGKTSSQVEYCRPFDGVDLPSRGLLYDGALKDKKSIEVCYLTAREEDILSSPNLLRTGKMIDSLLLSAFKEKTIDPSSLLVGDRNVIMIWLRSTGYGSEYPVRINCRFCDSPYEHEFNLSTLEIKYLDKAPDENNLFFFTLPTSKKRIKFSFLIGKDEADIVEIISARKTKISSNIDTMVTLRMLKMIKEVDGISNIKSFVENMPAKDSREFRKYATEIEPGIVMKQEVKCPSCGAISEENIPIQPNFFWPDFGI
jgi:hypothetical protein